MFTITKETASEGQECGSFSKTIRCSWLFDNHPAKKKTTNLCQDWNSGRILMRKTQQATIELSQEVWKVKATEVVKTNRNQGKWTDE